MSTFLPAATDDQGLQDDFQENLNRRFLGDDPDEDCRSCGQRLSGHEVAVCGKLFADAPAPYYDAGGCPV